MRNRQKRKRPAHLDAGERAVWNEEDLRRDAVWGDFGNPQFKWEPETVWSESERPTRPPRV